jgi:tetratricopeptide (TPR) repeat protein
MLVTLPFTLLLLDIWPLGRVGPPGVGEPSVWLKRVKEKLPMFVLAFASSAVTFLLQQRGGTVAKLAGVPFGLRLANVFVSYVTYVGKMLWPSSLAALYPYPRSIPPWWVATASLLLVGVSLMIIRAARRRPYLFVGWFWYLGTLVPVIGLVQVGPQSIADRYTYIPLLGLFILVAWWVPDLPLQPRLRGNTLRAVAVGVILAYAMCARDYLHYWRNSVALWHRTLEVTHDNHLAHDNLGVALADQGKLAEAIVHFSEALRIKPDFANAHYNLGNALAEQGNLAEAAAHFSQALRIKPDFANAHDSLGIALARQGNLAEAVAHFSEALRIRPDFASAHNDLGVALAEQGKLAEAVAHFSEALRLEPENADAHYGLGAALARQGKLEEAIWEFREALRIEPNAPEYHYNLGLAFEKKGQTGEAALQFEEALRLNPKHQGARQRLNLTRQGKGSDGGSRR